MHSGNDGVISGSRELEVITIVDQALELGALSVVADADDGCFSDLDDVYQCFDATPVTRTYSVHLIHDDYSLLGSYPFYLFLLSQLRLVQLVRLVKVVQVRVARKSPNIVFNRCFTSNVGSILFDYFIAKLLTDNPGRR